MEDLVSNFLSEKNIDSEITFEKYIMSKTMLNNEKQYSVKDICCFNANNDNFKQHYDENKILEIHLNNMVFEQDLSFDNVKKLSLIIDDNVKFQRLCIFGCNELSLRINGRVKIIDKISINNCKFKQISINNHIDGNIEFQKCEFNNFNLYGFSNATIKGAFTFDFCEVKEKVNFMNFEFENKVSFKMSKFKDNVYFNNTHFKDYVDFHECEFEKIACFYGVKFYKTPNFSACYFKEPKAVNLINVDIDKLDFKSVEKYIEDNYKDESYKNETKGIQDKKEIFKIQNEHKLRYAKNLKDSFRVIKDVLITQNNTLEAQEWHKLELYAKEKENHINLSVKDREKNADIFKNILIWFNCVLLNVYRNTSDHHNDFLKILNFTVGMIVLYGVFIFFCQACIEPYSKFFNELKSSVIFIIIGILVFLCCIMFYFNRKKSIFAKSIFFIIAMVFIVLYLVTYFYKTNEYKTILYLVMCYILSIYICYFFFNIKNIIFNIVFKFMLYLVFLFFLINSSQLINPFTGVFSSDKLYESQFEKSLNDLNASAIVNLASILQNDFNLHLKDQNISFTELNSAKALIIANKEKLKEILSKVYNDKYVSDYKKVLNELENNTSNVKNIIEEIDNKNNNSVVSAQLNKFLKLNFSQEIDILYAIKSNFSISEKLSPEQMALFDQKDSQDKLKSVLALLKFKSSFEGILKIINQDEITENTIKSTGVLYGIILLLCIFSLQKTARKNSIVPS
ncbi:pentapeptide repeat-containing protein [Campylobacter jejuni]|uniref:Pentapeptide repeat-containing protein n=1 Tax=Campylobacter jejuni TaxID=197 RepID=A0A630BWR1_CAMJU|nr:pentapeptide repeat-containing protein [Campylobacter jejuni]EAK7135724.1 pentapeptide repeat-containing protein [Campylobacter jejuni]EAV9714160.1 pentapeptide repeat-containing protein [Campylobacter jejuni]EDG1981679.1 pentapeptide repeat-containing protein [Campylobacter jejuni]EDP4247504.1 pentapeptide repeat-containing protein [Campylobacter jejuni]